MTTRPPASGTRTARTLVALAFAVVSVVWSIGSIRKWVAENRENGLIELRGRREWQRELPEETLPNPTRALAALATRQSTAPLTNAASLFNTTNFWTVNLRFTPD